LKNSWPRFVLAIALLTAACSDKDPVDIDDEVNVTGNYTLQTINGRPLPYLLISFAGIFELAQIGGSLAINENGTYTERAMTREATNDSVGVPQIRFDTITLAGHWEVEDSAIVLLPNNNSIPLFGLIGVNRLTLNYEAQNDSLVTYGYVRTGGSASRPLAFQTSSMTSSVSTILLRTTTSSMIGRRSTTTSSEAVLRASMMRASVARSAR
jgi:hypothetical protein